MPSLSRQPAYRLHRTARMLRAHLLGVLAPVELTPEQYFVLMRVEPEGTPQGELGDPDLDDRATISRQVSALQLRGLLVRAPDPHDSRIQRVTLTAAGQGLLDELRPTVDAERARLFGTIPASDLQAFHRILDALEQALR